MGRRAREVSDEIRSIATSRLASVLHRRQRARRSTENSEAKPHPGFEPSMTRSSGHSRHAEETLRSASRYKARWKGRTGADSRCAANSSSRRLERLMRRLFLAGAMLLAGCSGRPDRRWPNCRSCPQVFRCARCGRRASATRETHICFPRWRSTASTPRPRTYRRPIEASTGRSWRVNAGRNAFRGVGSDGNPRSGRNVGREVIRALMDVRAKPRGARAYPGGSRRPGDGIW